MVYIVLILVGLLVLLYIGRPAIRMKQKKELGIRHASLIYTDEKGAKMLVAEALGLQGKPDMIFESWLLKRLIPLEIKSGKLKEEMPHLGDLYQLVTYFIIIEAVYGRKPPYGKLVYANKTFIVQNRKKLRREVLQVIEEMRDLLDEKIEVEVEPSYIKCKNCICKDTVCEFCDL